MYNKAETEWIQVFLQGMLGIGAKVQRCSHTAYLFSAILAGMLHIVVECKFT